MVIDADGNMAEQLCECKLLVAPMGHRFYPNPGILSIFIRHHYDNIIPKLRLDYEKPAMDKLTTVLTGTPGVGKSLFAVYLLWYILHNPVLFRNINVIIFIRNTRASVSSLWAFCRAQDDHWCTMDVTDGRKPDLFIYDRSFNKDGDIMYEMEECFNILITSPRVSC